MRYWLVRQTPWFAGHTGPFSTADDAELAKLIASPSWRSARVVPDDEFHPYEGKL